ncbi:MAG TPA: cupin domain-containing protein [Thermoleophilaceae bacterium]|jgi:quercetin dioxygenase-like cupin family protein
MIGAEGVQVLGPDGPSIDLVEGEGSARALVWPDVGAEFRSMHLILLGAGARTRRQRHQDEAVYYVLGGSGSVAGEQLEEGSMVHVAAGAAYVFEAGADGLELIGGPSPPDAGVYEGVDADGENEADPGAIRIFHRDNPDVMLPMIASDARLVVWLGVGARNANMNYVSMQPGEENVPHAHADSEDTIYIVSGCGTVEDLTHGFALEFEAGQAIQVPPGIQHRVKADRGSPVVSVGGPCPADVGMLKAAGVLPADLS